MAMSIFNDNNLNIDIAIFIESYVNRIKRRYTIKFGSSK